MMVMMTMVQLSSEEVKSGSQLLSLPLSHAVSLFHRWHFLCLHFILSQSGNRTSSVLVWLLSFSAVNQSLHVNPDPEIPIQGLGLGEIICCLYLPTYENHFNRRKTADCSAPLSLFTCLLLLYTFSLVHSLPKGIEWIVPLRNINFLLFLCKHNANVHWSTYSVIKIRYFSSLTQHLGGCTQMSLVYCKKLITCTLLHVQIHAVIAL